MVVAPDTAFSDPRLAAVYDVFEDERDDLEVYAAMAAEFRSASVLDVGCGTGELVCRLALRGLDVIGVDPAPASLDVARSKARHLGLGDRVIWVEGDAPALVDALPTHRFDLAIMTGNVAQVFIADDDWAETLEAIGTALRPAGLLVFETRRPDVRSWETWTPDRTRQRAALPTGEKVETWCDLLDVTEDPLMVSFRWTFVFQPATRRERSTSDAAPEVLTSDSTLRFRSHDEIVASLECSGFDVVEVREAPDRPGREMVFVARWVDE